MCNLNDLKKQGSKEQRCCACRIIFAACFIVSVALIIGGFFVPPMGIIDGSVLTAVGELFAFPTLAYGFRAIELGFEMKIQHGDTRLVMRKEDGE